MKRTLCFLMAALLAGLLAVSCGSTGGGGASSYKAPVGAEGVPQPDWVRNVPDETGDTVYFVGEGRTGTTSTAKKGTARRDVDNQIARWVGAKVDAIMKDYVEESGETGKTQSLESFKDAVRTTASANTSSIKESKSWVAEDGAYMLLCTYSKIAFKSDFKKEFQRNKSSVFANTEADKMFELLDKELEKY
jgi:hypothetical protein